MRFSQELTIHGIQTNGRHGFTQRLKKTAAFRRLDGIAC